MQHRIAVAGGDRRTLFAPEAVRVLHDASGGIPRILNHLATQALLEGMARGAKVVDAGIAEAVVSSQPLLEMRGR
jgi:type II secretory pathway predicted ATPase ExeA